MRETSRSIVIEGTSAAELIDKLTAYKGKPALHHEIALTSLFQLCDSCTRVTGLPTADFKNLSEI